MPLVDPNAAATWDGGVNSLYTSYRNGLPVGLNRTEFLSGYYSDTDRLIEALVTVGLQKGQRIALVGGQFGWIAERFITQGYGPIADGTTAGRIVVVDTSTWIQANKAGNATLNIVNSDVNGATGRRAIRQQLGSNNQTIDWSISCCLLPMLTDNECAPLAASMRQLSTNVAHWLTPIINNGDNQDPRLNLKTLEAWKALMTPDYVVWEGRSTIL